MAKPILLLLLLLLLHASLAHSYDPYTQHRPNFHPSKGLLIVGIISIALLLIAFLSLYIQRCRNHRPADALPLLLMRRYAVAPKRGLDPSIIESFPTLTCAELLEARLKNPKSVECAVCISEFVGHETLRLLPVCGHAFHLDCIDMWLESHITCPVCRDRLDTVVPGDAVTVEVGGVEGERSEGRVPGGLKRCSSSVTLGGGGRGRWEWKVKSDRWAFTARVLPAEGEARNVKGEGTSRDGGIEA